MPRIKQMNRLIGLVLLSTYLVHSQLVQPKFKGIRKKYHKPLKRKFSVLYFENEPYEKMEPFMFNYQQMEPYMFTTIPPKTTSTEDPLNPDVTPTKGEFQ